MAKTKPMGDVLRDAIRQGGWTALALSQKTGVPAANIRAFLRGRDLPLSRAAMLADFLGLELTRKRKLPKPPAGPAPLRRQQGPS
jgi:hypothetical protein